MPREFELRKEITLDATPEQVWEAIATGPGIDAWFMGRNRVEPREGGTTSMAIGEHTEEATVTAWEPPRRFAYRAGSPEAAEFMAFEWLVQGRDDGTSAGGRRRRSRSWGRGRATPTRCGRRWPTASAWTPRRPRATRCG